MLQLLKPLCLSALVSLSPPVGAMALALSPDELEERAPVAELEVPALEKAQTRIAPAVLPQGIEESLLFSREARSIPDEQPAQQAPASEPQSSAVVAVARSDYQDPLAMALRGLVNVAPGQAAGSVRAGRTADDPGQALAEDIFEHGVDPEELESQEAVEARLNAAKQDLAHVAEWVLAPEVAADGGIEFSVLGLSGFRAEIEGGEAAVAFQGLNLSSTGSGPIGPQEPRQRPGSSASASEEAAERILVLRLAFLMWDVASHPFTLACMTLLLVGRLLAGLATRSSPSY